MKIGIITFPLNNNYGNLLQAYALMTVLKRIGHTPWLLDIRRSNQQSVLRKHISIVKNIVKKYLLKRSIFSVVPSKDIRHNELKQLITGQYSYSFIDKYLYPKISPLYSSEELAYLAKNIEFDAFIVGSDQIWRPTLMRKFIKTAYFDFLKDKKIKRLAYAASFGTDEWEYTPNLEQECAELIKKFDAVSVRETSGIKMCKEHFNMDAQLVLDPTLLLKTEDYVDLQENTDAGSENLFCYILDKTDDKQALIDSVSQHLSLNPVYMGLNTEGQSIKQRVFEPVEIWLTNFQKSKFVITDSFHGMIFSIIYNKPFIVYGNKRRGISRFESILNVLNLQNRLVFTSTIDEALTTKNNINWEMVNNKISELRQESVDFLYKYLR